MPSKVVSIVLLSGKGSGIFLSDGRRQGRRVGSPLHLLRLASMMLCKRMDACTFSRLSAVRSSLTFQPASYLPCFPKVFRISQVTRNPSLFVEWRACSTCEIKHDFYSMDFSSMAPYYQRACHGSLPTQLSPSIQTTYLGIANILSGRHLGR